MPRGQPSNEEQPLEDGEIVVDGFPMQADIPGERTGVEQLGSAQRKQLEQTSNLATIPDARHVLDVALDDGAQILAMPLAGADGRAAQRLRKSTFHQSLRERDAVFGRLDSDFRLQLAGQPRPQERSGLALFLGFGERVELNDFHPSRERIAELRQQVGRSGQQEAPRTPVVVDGDLDRAQQLGRALNLVERDLFRQRGDESRRVAARGRQDAVVVQAEICALGAKRACERALAALARAKQADDRRVGERRRQRAPELARIEGCCRSGTGRPGSVQLSVSIASNCRLSIRPDGCLVSVQLTVDRASSCRLTLPDRAGPPRPGPCGAHGVRVAVTRARLLATLCVWTQPPRRIGSRASRMQWPYWIPWPPVARSASAILWHSGIASSATTSRMPPGARTMTRSPAAIGRKATATLSAWERSVACQSMASKRRAEPADDVLALVEDLAPGEHAGGDLDPQRRQPLRRLLQPIAALERAPRLEVELLAQALCGHRIRGHLDRGREAAHEAVADAGREQDELRARRDETGHRFRRVRRCVHHEQSGSRWRLR